MPFKEFILKTFFNVNVQELFKEINYNLSRYIEEKMRAEQCKQRLETLEARKKELEKELFEVKVENTLYHSMLVPYGERNKESKFDVFFDKEEEKWAIVTGYCNVGGCEYTRAFDNELDARRKAIEMTLLGKEPGSAGACPSCVRELRAEGWLI